MSTSRLRACLGGAGVTRDKRQRQTQVEKRVRWLRWAQMGANGWDVWTPWAVVEGTYGSSCVGSLAQNGSGTNNNTKEQ
jgi:hypothetical protein